MKWLVAVFISLLTFFVHAEEPLLSAEDAFSFSVESKNQNNTELSWNIPENYYLYKYQFSVKDNQKNILLKLPKAHDLYDENYGNTQVYFNSVKFEVPTQASQTYVVKWQGCAKDRICYPPQFIEFKTNIDGLVEVQNQGITGLHRKKNLDLANQIQKEKPTSTLQNAEKLSTSTLNTSATENTADDQIWSQKLVSNHWIYGFILFFGLGILLAFTPCSLPMLPILTSLIVRDQRGVKAWIIALVFVCSMASVYAILGLIASSAGLNFQRWLQQPSTLIAFSCLFILFALNLFGLFEIKLPQVLVQKLDQAQSVQKGGTLLGAAVMGMISALLVGPCMTAPLAGALLFISQTQNQWHGALLLFVLGLGMGMPLLLASILGAHVLPKAGQWMNQIKVIFAFIMLGLALYFVRPLLSAGFVQVLSLLLELSFILYILKCVYQQKNRWKWLYIGLFVISLPYVIYSQYQQSQRFFDHVSTAQNQWHIAHNTHEFEQLLKQAPKNKNVIVDVYADWCIACQPIENRILKSAKVQQELQAFYLIKLDLSDYDVTHQALLNEWDILGPPTYLFLNAQQQEIRGLRLTGTFTEEKLLEQLGKLKNIKD
ncbi:thiol:disulfide interchange protein [Acinetobacter equi]|uniref:Thiol:disulfide interchange protein n=1 Tax=Acinetobacter equi TaxID=1324350 RepID=A0A0N9W1V2_9GAMM|nr:thiol:disulfide interchange protein [Acinetobacter equi]